MQIADKIRLSEIKKIIENMIALNKIKIQMMRLLIINK